MAVIQFNQKQVNLAKTEPPKPKVVKRRKILRCEIDGYVLRIGIYKVTKTWAIKFAKWILKSFGEYDYE